MYTKPGTEEVITSLQNPKVKNTLLLQKPGERKKQSLFVVEGKVEVVRAIRAGYTFKQLFLCKEIFEPDPTTSLIRELSGNQTGKPEINFVTPRVYAHMAYRKESEGILGWAILRAHDLKHIKLSGNPLILVADAVEKPGNLGAIIRTTDAAGLDALIISDPGTDIYNPNVVRSSLGALFSVQIGKDSAEEVIRWLKKNRFNIYCTALSASKSYTEIDFKRSSAIIVGPEATGLSQIWLDQSDQNIIIPMYGSVDSMNVSVSAGIVLFEAIRQRQKAAGEDKLS
jgi:TrmH family RNA methyltransferase